MNEGTMKNCFQRRPVVLGQEMQEQTTVLREVLWSEGKKRKAGPQCPRKSCGPKAETQGQTIVLRESLWSQGKKCQNPVKALITKGKKIGPVKK